MVLGQKRLVKLALWVKDDSLAATDIQRRSFSSSNKANLNIVPQTKVLEPINRTTQDAIANHSKRQNHWLKGLSSHLSLRRKNSYLKKIGSLLVQKGRRRVRSHENKMQRYETAHHQRDLKYVWTDE